MAGYNMPRSGQGYIETFMREEAPRFHVALGPKMETGSEEELKSISLEKEDSLKKLEAALAHFRDKMTTPLDFDIDDCPWGEVIEQLTKALQVQQDHASTANSRRGVISHIWHAMGRSSKVVSPGLDCIPGEVGFSVLKGALALVFSVARFKVENLDKILGAFENVPSILLEAEEIRQSHPGDGVFENKLNIAIEELYLRLAEGLRELIRILTPKGVNHIVSVIKGAEIDKVTEDVDRCINRVRALDKRLRDAREAQTYSLQKDTNIQVTEIRQELNRKISTGSDLSAGYASDVSETAELVRMMSKDIKGRASEASIINLTTEIQEMKDMLRGLANEGLFLFLEEQLHQFRKKVPIELAKRLESLRLELASDEDVEAFVGIVGSRSLDSIRDVERVLRKQSSIPSAAEQEARSLWKSSDFLRWLHSRESDFLFVTSSSVHPGRTSALSIVCATMAVQLLDEDYHPNFWVHFFCGEHTKAEDELAGPESMIGSLVAQLAIHLHSRELLYIGADWSQRLTHGGTSRLETLCYLFSQLLSQLPDGSTLFCVVDGVSQYQNDDLLHVARHLKNGAFNTAVPAKIKILMTGPTRFERLVQSLELQPWQHVKLNRATARGGEMLVPPTWTRRSARRKGTGG